MSKDLGYTFCSAADSRAYFVAAVVKELEDRDVSHAVVFEYHDGQWMRWSMRSRIRSLIALRELNAVSMMVLTEEGRVRVSRRGEVSDEDVDPGEEGPTRLRPLSFIRAIGSHVYAVGMQRQVYRRSLHAAGWERIDEAIRVPRSRQDIAGLRAIDGTPDEKQLIAVGLGGEIWSWRNGQWSPHDSPTNARLHTVRFVQPNKVVVAGARGLVLIGDGEDRWRELAHDAGNVTFSCIETAFGRHFLCAEPGDVYELTDDDRLVTVDVGWIGGGGWLDAGRDILLAAGNENVTAFDGAAWRDSTPPDAP